MLDRIANREINAELAATFIFAVASGLYLFFREGLPNMINSLFLWMFPASLMIFLSLVLVKIIERTSEKRMDKYRYIDWRRK